MPTLRSGGKLYHLLSVRAAFCRKVRLYLERGRKVVGLALALFIALFGWGAGYFGWTDPDGHIQFALFTSFVLGIVCGYRVRS